MGVLIEVPNYQPQANRFIIAPQNVYSGIHSVQYVTLLGASVGKGRNWTGRISMELAQRIFDDFVDAANKGILPAFYKDIRVTTYHGSDNTQRKVILPREAEPEHVEPEVPKVMKLDADGSVRYTPPADVFRKGPRDWTLPIAFVDSFRIPRSTESTGRTRFECLQRLFGSHVPWVVEYVKATYPLARPEDMPREPEPEVDYVPTVAEPHPGDDPRGVEFYPINGCHAQIRA